MLELQAAPVVDKTLECARQGRPYQEYRIPGVVVTAKGTLLCCYEARKALMNDWAPIDLKIRRSADEGESWSEYVIDHTVVEPLYGEVTFNNPVLLAEGATIHLLFCQNYERAYHCVSRDDGQSWSTPRDITAVFDGFDVPWNVCAVGPGHGIATREGRLIVPIWIANGAPLDETGRVKDHQPSRAGAIWSDDHGETWHAGGLFDGFVNANETCVAQTLTGDLLFNIRHGGEEDLRGLAWSKDGAISYERSLLCSQLPDPRCFGGMAAMADGTLAFVNCAHARPSRRNLVVSLSEDEGETWRQALRVAEIAAYADMAAAPDGIWVFFEYRDGVNKYATHLILRKYALKEVSASQ